MTNNFASKLFLFTFAIQIRLRSMMEQKDCIPNNYSSLMKARKEGLLVQSEREYREERYRVVENQINNRQQLFEQYYGDVVSQKERNDYYMFIDRLYRGLIADSNVLYPEAVMEKIRQVRHMVAELRQLGVNENTIAELTKEEKTLSRLFITSDYRIFLPEYNNAEVKLHPLPKALFILFLRHPEGIVLKEMADYFTELLSIYKVIVGDKYQEKAKRSLERICNPLDNSINEKISRINEVLRQLMDEAIAVQYFISGKRNEARQIMLPQTLISWA